MNRQRILLNGFFLVIFIGLDQLIKYIVEQTMYLGEDIPLLPWLSLLHARNPGIAFSMLSGFNDLALIIITTLVIIFVFWLWIKNPKSRWLVSCGFLLIASGAIGNLIDRIRFNYVIDYIYFHIEDIFSFAVFNLADAFISIGAILIIVGEIFNIDHNKSRQNTPSN